MASFVRRAWRHGVHALACTGALFLVYHGFFEVARVTSGSMAPLLRGPEDGDADRILAETRFTAGAAPGRFAVVLAETRHHEVVVKRVVGLPGEAVSLTREGGLLIDGAPVALPDGVARYLPFGNLRGGSVFQVPEGHVYLMGDETRDSQDSRFEGAFPLERVRGRVLARVWPLERAGAL
ncbi:MAG: signal peptidase I [Planctomycetes bacterium]|nr:signal peptidase I [Planctomycetota bacterium]